MKFHIDGLVSLIRAIGAVLAAEVLLAYFVEGYRDADNMTLIFFISILMAACASFRRSG